MAVLVVAKMPGGATDADEWHERNKSLPEHQGFLFQADGPLGTGWQVLSAWESREDFERYFDAVVRPNIPPGVATEFHDLASVVK